MAPALGLEETAHKTSLGDKQQLESEEEKGGLSTWKDHQEDKEAGHNLVQERA